MRRRLHAGGGQNVEALCPFSSTSEHIRSGKLGCKLACKMAHTQTHTHTQVKGTICFAENYLAEFSLRKRDAINKKAFWHTHSCVSALLPQSLI